MKLITFLLTLFLAGIALAQSRPFSYALVYDITAKESLAGVQFAPLPTQHDLFGIRGFDVDVLGLLGGNENGEPTVGGIVARPFAISKETQFSIGLGGRVQSGMKPHGFLYLSLGTRN